jgi:hypothetical protein
MSGVFGHSPTVIASYRPSTSFISDRNSAMRGPLQYWSPANCHSLPESVTGASLISPLLYMFTVSTLNPSTPRSSQNSIADL